MVQNFLNLENKTYFISGVANKKSVAAHITRSLLEQGAKCLLSVQKEEMIPAVSKLFPECPLIVCDVANDEHVKNLEKNLRQHTQELNGFVHSLAFANFEEGVKPFLETSWKNYQEASKISCFSFTEMSQALKNLLTKEASIVTISISNTKATSYGYLGPIKAMLDATVPFLAKSFSEFSHIRVNAIGAGPLKTSASAGIPDYIDNYLYAEELTLRKRALETQEVANCALFLLSPMSSGINATTMLVDAGMSVNYFDQKIVKAFAQNK